MIDRYIVFLFFIGANTWMMTGDQSPFLMGVLTCWSRFWDGDFERNKAQY